LVARQSIQLAAVAPFCLDGSGLRQLHQLVDPGVLSVLLQDQQGGPLGSLLQQGPHRVQPENHRELAHPLPPCWLRRRCHGPRTMLCPPPASASSKSILRSSMTTLIKRPRKWSANLKRRPRRAPTIRYPDLSREK